MSEISNGKVPKDGLIQTIILLEIAAAQISSAGAASGCTSFEP